MFRKHLDATLRYDDYENKFDSKRYLEFYAAADPGSQIASDEGDLLQHMLQSNDEFFTGCSSGGTLLDLGAGPSIFNAIGGCHLFDRIWLAEFTDANRCELQKFKDNAPGAHDWSTAFKHHAKLRGCDSKHLENLLREKIDRIIPCDVLKQPMMEGSEKFDCIITTLCLEAAAPNYDAYKKAVKGIAQLLKDDGRLKLTSVLGQTFYDVGEVRFSTLPLTANDIRGAFEEANLEILGEMSGARIGTVEEDSSSDYTGFFSIIAKRSKQTG